MVGLRICKSLQSAVLLHLEQFALIVEAAVAVCIILENSTLLIDWSGKASLMQLLQ